MIKIKNISHSIGGTQILDNVSLDIPKGSITALVGPNGAGKSSLLSLIARLMPVQKGEIWVDDLKLGQCASDILARKLSILPQDLQVAARLSVEELVSFGRYPHSKGRLNAHDKALIAKAIDIFDLTPFAQRPLETLSGGQRQRAFLAMTYAQDTDYLLLDEPLNNLDITSSQSLMLRLQDLARNSGKTIVIVIHDINFAARYADNIVAICNGKCAGCGCPETLIDTNFMASVFGAETQIQIINGKPVVLV